MPGPPDECAKNPCHEFADCTNVGSSYTCDCKDGYMGNGVFCMGMTNISSRVVIILWVIIYNSNRI